MSERRTIHTVIGPTRQGSGEEPQSLRDIVEAIIIDYLSGDLLSDIQADWDEEDTTSVHYIQNKPTIPQESVYIAQIGDLFADIYDAYTTGKVILVVDNYGRVYYLSEYDNASFYFISIRHNHAYYIEVDDDDSWSDWDVVIPEKLNIITNTGSEASIQLSDNTEYRCGTLNTLSITTQANLPDEYVSWLVFSSGSTPTTISYPATWKWSGDEVSSNTFTPAPNKTYNIGIWYDGTNINAIARGV